jgi:hypothetical protein
VRSTSHRAGQDESNEGVSGVKSKSIWLSSLLIPVGVVIVVGVCITAIGEFYLSLGDDALFAALPLMFIVVIIAAVLASRTEADTNA